VLAKACAAIAEAHAGRDAALREAGETLAALGPKREAVCASLSEKRAQANKSEGGAVAERASLEALRSERSLLLGGKTVAQVERAQAAAQRASREALELAQNQFGAEDRRLAAAESALSGVDRALEGAREKAEATAAALGSALATHGLDRARLDLLLGRNEAWMASERKALDALEAAVRDELTKRAERQRKLEAHGAVSRPSFTLGEAKDRAAAADLAEKQAAQEHTAVHVRLLDDDRNRAALAELERDLTGQRAVTARWAALATLIGSHDGSALRIFAQGLALRALLQAANQHLENLAPRYRLEPVPRRDLDIQVVDGDLGNEVRGVNGLSGGESFLVSLALALGLASLSTRRTQARTLFIDEGFGTLDRDTLEQAMAAIDQLGSGERTVGVISHVPELHERIGVKVTVERVSAGRSRIVLPEGMPVARERPVASPRRAS
jgi:exonuclease SbcC